MRIKKGKKYKCVKSFKSFIKGEVHRATKDNKFYGFLVNGATDYTSHFKKVTSKKSLKKRVEALEKSFSKVEYAEAFDAMFRQAPPTVDHQNLSNLQSMCRKCNQLKADN